VNTALYVLLSASVLITLVSGSRLALYVIVLLIPTLQVLPAPIGTAGSASTLIVLALMRLAFSSPGPTRKRESTPLVTPIVFVLVTWVIGLAVSASEAPFGMPFEDSLRNTWYWAVAYVLYFLMLKVDIDDREMDKLIRLCQWSMGLECALTVVEAASGVGRATAHLGDPNAAGSYFASSGVFFLVWLVHSRGFWSKAALLAGCLVATVALFNTVSRGGLVAAFLGIAVVGTVTLFSPGRSTVWKVSAVGLAIALAISIPFIVPEKVKERVLGTVESDEAAKNEETGLDDNAQERVEYWWFAWDLFRDRPTGYGAFEFPSILATHFKRGKQTHNVYMELLVEQGIQGLIAVLALLVATFRFLAKSYRPQASLDRDSILALSLMGWLTAHAAAHFFLNSYFSVNMTGQFWILTALLVSSRSRSALAGPTPIPARDPRARGRASPSASRPARA
jgi:hypothetical protein